MSGRATKRFFQYITDKFYLEYFNFQALRTNAFDEIGYMSNKFNYMDTLTLTHCFRNLTFKDDFFNDIQFECKEDFEN